MDEPSDEWIKQATELSQSYARLVLGNLFVLNGGGLAAMPAFAALIPRSGGGSALEALPTLMPAAFAFVAGLVAAIAAAAAAFAGFDALRSRLGQLRLATWQSSQRNLEAFAAAGVSRAKALLEANDALHLTEIAIGSAVLSGCSFIAGWLLFLGSC